MRLSEDQFAALVEQALEELPEQFAEMLDNVAIDVEDQPDAQVVHEMGPGSRRGLLGLYRGVPLTKRSVESPWELPHRVTLYQGNIERMCRNRRDIIRQIRRTVLHEIGHHFGMSEDDLDRLGYG